MNGKQRTGQSRLELTMIAHAVPLGSPCSGEFLGIQDTKPRACAVETILSSARYRRIGEGEKRCGGGLQVNKETVG
jgi:hypothetical protein